MAVTVKKAVLWRKELENKPGTLAETLKPLADSGVSLQVVMGYAFPGEHEHAAVEVFPITGGKAEAAANQAGLQPSPRIACLLVQGDDRPGLGHLIADRLSTNGINISFVIVQTTNKKYMSVFGFETEEDAERAVSIIKDATKEVTVRKIGKPRRAAAARTQKTKGVSRVKKPGAKKATAKSTAARKTGASKTTAKKATTKKTTATKKPAARKSTAKKTTTTKGRR